MYLNSKCAVIWKKDVFFFVFLKFCSNFYEYSFSSYLQYFLQSKSKLFSKWWVLPKAIASL